MSSCPVYNSGIGRSAFKMFHVYCITHHLLQLGWGHAIDSDQWVMNRSDGSDTSGPKLLCNLCCLLLSDPGSHLPL